jgi:hypothetical protein
MEDFLCEYFAGCFNQAAGVVTHPILKYVPCCQRCADRLGMTILEVEFTG